MTKVKKIFEAFYGFFSRSVYFWKLRTKSSSASASGSSESLNTDPMPIRNLSFRIRNRAKESVFRIHIGPDLDPALKVNTDPDPGIFVTKIKEKFAKIVSFLF